MKLKGLILSSLLLFAGISIAETWRLGTDQQWKPLSADADSEFMIAVVNAKGLVANGRTSKAQRAFEKLKQDYPELAGADFDSFVRAELLYSRGKYTAAAAAYSNFMNSFPQSPFYRAALQRQNQIASAFLSGRKKTVLGVFKVRAYDEGAEIMHSIADRAGDGPEAKKALTDLARLNERRGDNYQAYQSWADVAARWPAGDTGAEAVLGMARSLSNAYKGPLYESKILESSRSYYVKYKEAYPAAAEEIDVPAKLEKIDARLAEKELTVADYYRRTGSDVAAGIYYRQIIDDFDGTAAAAEAQKKLDELEKQMAQKAQAQRGKKFDWKGLFL